MREPLTDLLDALALLLIAAGLGCQVTGWIVAAFVGSQGVTYIAIGAGFFVAGMIVLGGSWLAARPARIRVGDPQ